jgi:hypothetical protein
MGSPLMSSRRARPWMGHQRRTDRALFAMLAAWTLPSVMPEHSILHPGGVDPHLFAPVGRGLKDGVDHLKVGARLNAGARVGPGIVKLRQLAVCSTQDSEHAVHCCLCRACRGRLRMLRPASLAAAFAYAASAVASLDALLSCRLTSYRQRLFLYQQLSDLRVRALHPGPDRSPVCCLGEDDHETAMPAPNTAFIDKNTLLCVSWGQRGSSMGFTCDMNMDAAAHLFSQHSCRTPT